MTIDNMTTEIFTLLAAVLGAVLGAGATYYFSQQSKNKSKILETNTIPTSLVDPSKTGTLLISVDKELLTGQAADKGILEKVTSAYSFSISISNVGNDDIERPEIHITLDEKATILSCEFKPEPLTPDKYKIIKDPNRPNYLQIIPNYVNKQENFVISILSVNNQTEDSKVAIGGVGIKQQVKATIINEAQRQRDFFLGAGFVIIILLIIYTFISFIETYYTSFLLLPNTPTPAVIATALSTPLP